MLKGVNDGAALSDKVVVLCVNVKDGHMDNAGEAGHPERQLAIEPWMRAAFDDLRLLLLTLQREMVTKTQGDITGEAEQGRTTCQVYLGTVTQTVCSTSRRPLPTSKWVVTMTCALV
jgi:hypothetical protein